MGAFALCLRQNAFLLRSSTIRVHSLHKKAFFLGREQNPLLWRRLLRRPLRILSRGGTTPHHHSLCLTDSD